MFGLSANAVEDRISPEASPNARTVRVPVGQVTNGACELTARGRTGRVAPDEGGDIRIKLDTNSYEGRGGALTYEVVFVLGCGVAKLASA